MFLGMGGKAVYKLFAKWITRLSPKFGSKSTHTYFDKLTKGIHLLLNEGIKTPPIDMLPPSADAFAFLKYTEIVCHQLNSSDLRGGNI